MPIKITTNDKNIICLLCELVKRIILGVVIDFFDQHFLLEK